MLLFQFFTLLLLYCVDCQKLPCPKVLAVNITDGLAEGDAIIKDGLRYEKHNYFLENDVVYGCVCNLKSCLRKCCGPDKIMAGKNCTKRSVNITVPVHHGTEPKNDGFNHHFVHNRHCEYRGVLLTPHLYSEDQFYIQQNGSLYLPYFEKKQMRHPEDYCVDIFDTEDMNSTFSVLLCNLKDDVIEDDMGQHVMYSGMIISIPFLLATFIAYALLPDRNLHMKALMFYVITLMLSYLLLVVVQLSKSSFADSACEAIGYFCLFFFMVSFFWMNVICIDIWLAFSGLRGFSGSKKIAERNRFFIYCAYAWLMPIAHILIVYAIQQLSDINGRFNPSIGQGQCFLKRGYPELLYFYGPMAILITINIVLFAITAIKIRSVKKDTSVLKKEDSKRHSYENDKQNFNLYLKLLFAMGVNWSMEIISWAVILKYPTADYIWYLTDFCNAIYGVFIFFIFVFKKSIWKLLKKRYYSFMGRPHLAHSMASTNATRTTSYSTSNVMHDNHHGGGVHDTTVLTSEA